MIVLGVDPSKWSTGWCLIDTDTDWLKCGTLPNFEGGEFEVYHSAFMAMGRTLKRETPPNLDRIFWIERPMYHVPTVTKRDMTGEYKAAAGNIKTTCVLHGVFAAFCSAIGLMKFRPYEDGTVMPATWRKAFFGKGFKTDDWKKACTQHLAYEGIHVNNHDEAEATAIAKVLAAKVTRHHDLLDTDPRIGTKG